MNKQKFPSRYSSGSFITAAQYIAELMCEKQAQKKKIELPQRFWNLAHWKKPYKIQILAAQGLLKIYDVKAILSALKSKDAYSIYSLHAPYLDDIIKREQRSLQARLPSEDVNVERKSTTEKPREHRVKKTELGKLRGLDD
jgi:hypothetical protein